MDTSVNSPIGNSFSGMSASRAIKLCGFVVLAVSMTSGFTGCSSGSGSDNVANPDLTEPPSDGGVVYRGPAEETADVINFKLNIWNNLAAENRCGGCHGTGGQTPTFVRDDNINLAYNAANSIIDLSVPSSSRMVTKVGGGHNCWQSNAAVCAEIITNWIEAWVNVSGGSSNVITLTPVPESKIRDPGETKFFPDDTSNFGPLYNILTQEGQGNCGRCHAEDGSQMRQQPFFASKDIDVAYENAKSKIDINNPANSRFVVRLRNESHNCWGAATGKTCENNAKDVQDAITAYAATIETRRVDVDTLVVSKAMNLAADGILASSGGRNEANVIALYEFKDKEDEDTAFDTSGVTETPLDLTLSGGAKKLPAFGLQMNGGKAQGSTKASRKLYDLISATGEYSIEAWVVPENVTQEGPARIVSYSGGNTIRNFTLGQSMYNYDFLNRSSVTDANGMPALSTDDAAEVAQASLQHVVVTFDALNGRRIYVNGEYTGDLDEAGAGSLAEWDDTFALVLGKEVSNADPWAGTIRLLAIYNRVMGDEQIRQNFDAGVGEKFFLMFSVSHLLDGVPDVYVVFQAEVFDASSYLFSAPFFQILDAGINPGSIPIKNMRIGLNGREVPVGQVFAKLDTRISDTAYAAERRQLLSRMGAVIALEEGPEQDEFFLTFDQFGTHSYARTVPSRNAYSAPVSADLEKQSRVALHTFEEIDASMSTLTGVARSNSSVQNTFNNVKQQLPAVASIDGFLSSHQMGIVQLAASYCGALVDDTTLRQSYFPGFDFSANVSTAFGAQTGRDAIVGPLVDRLLTDYLPDVPNAERPPGSTLPGDPTLSEVTGDELDKLILALGNCTDCGSDAARTQTIVKAACTATLGNAVMLLQ